MCRIVWLPCIIWTYHGARQTLNSRKDAFSDRATEMIPCLFFRYVTEGTFDSYSWQVIENKQKFISQIMTSKSPVRSCEDVDEAALTYAEVKALATGNPYIKEKMDLDIQVSRLKLMKANHTSQIYRLEDNIAKNYPKQIEILQERIRGFQTDMETVRKNLPADKDNFSMKVGNRIFIDKRKQEQLFLPCVRRWIPCSRWWRLVSMPV